MGSSGNASQSSKFENRNRPSLSLRENRSRGSAGTEGIPGLESRWRLLADSELENWKTAYLPFRLVLRRIEPINGLIPLTARDDGVYPGTGDTGDAPYGAKPPGPGAANPFIGTP
jgi:hypothetical protein